MNTRSVVPAVLFLGGLTCVYGLVVVCSDGSIQAILLGIIAVFLLVAAGLKVDHV